MTLLRLKAMLVKEFIQVFRDPRMRIVLFVIPMLQTLIFSYAVDMDVRNIPTVILDRDNSSESRDLAAMMVSSGHFRIRAKIDGGRELQRLLDRGDARVALVIDHGFAAALGRGSVAPVQVILDGSDSNTAGVVMGYLARLAAEYNGRLQREFAARHRGAGLKAGRVEPVSRAWFNENLESPPSTSRR